MKQLILASQSPRRRQLLEQMGLTFEVKTACIDETMDPAKPLAEEIARLSRRKAEAVQAGLSHDAVIVAADTMVCIDGQRLGKPHSTEEAAAMLRQLSGRSHTVLSGVCVLCADRVETFTQQTDITFRPLSETEIAAYVATGEPMDKAGAYGIQGMGGLFVSSLNGDYYNVMGLPICPLAEVLRRFGVAVLGQDNATTC